MKQKLLILLCALMATAGAYSYDFSYFDGKNNLYFNKTSDNTCEITKGDIKYSGDIDIPVAVDINGGIYSVTAIGYGAFYTCWDLTSINIPSTVTSIGSIAFQGTALTSVVIPNSVNTIGMSAFYGCHNLVSVVLPNSLNSIETQTFWECTSLSAIEIPSSVTSIGKNAFYGCTGLASVEIPATVTSIGEGAFKGVPV